MDTPVSGDCSLLPADVRQSIEVIDAAHDFAQYQKFVLLKFVSVEHCGPKGLTGKAGEFRRKSTRPVIDCHLALQSQTNTNEG